MNIHERIADSLGWTEDQAKSFSLPTLRALVQTVNPKLAREITLVMNSREYWFQDVPKKRRRW